MKKIFALSLCFVLCFTLSSCGSMTVDLNTPKSSELKAEYDFYADSMNKIRVDMGITPEQADEVFIALVSIGMDSKITTIIKKYGSDNTYSVSWTGALSRDVEMLDGAVKEIRNGAEILYPSELATKTVNNAAMENAVALIENLSADSSRGDYEAAQSAYDTLSKSMQKEIPETLIKKLSDVNISTQTLEALTESITNTVKIDVSSIDIFDDEKTEATGDKMITVNANASDNLTANLIRTSILTKSSDLLKGLQPRTDISQVCILWSFPLVDSYGNTSNQVVMKILVLKESLDKINFENFDWNNFPTISEDYYEHSALNK